MLGPPTAALQEGRDRLVANGLSSPLKQQTAQFALNHLAGTRGLPRAALRGLEPLDERAQREAAPVLVQEGLRFSLRNRRQRERLLRLRRLPLCSPEDDAEEPTEATNRGPK